MAACFDQFDALYKISRSCRQLLFTTHWYGFFPTVEAGNASVITRQKGDHFIDLINLPSHREQVKQMSRQSKGKLPYDIRLKSINDFVQSIIASTMGDSPFNWLICEGSSEKIYFSEYFKDLVAEKRLRIVPVGGAKEIKRLYGHLSAAYDEFKSDIKGKIVLLSDTDPELVSYPIKEFSNLICKRIVNNQTTIETDLVNIDSNPVSPPTEIEDALNGRHVFNTLKLFSDEFEDLRFLNEMSEPFEAPAHFSLDLRPSEKVFIDNFFNIGNNKYEFAKRYSKTLSSNMIVPSWILEIRSWLNG